MTANRRSWPCAPAGRSRGPCRSRLRAAAALAASALAACSDGAPDVATAATAAVPPSPPAVSATERVSPPSPPAASGPAPAARLESVAAVDEAALGVPLYPGAMLDGGTASRIALPTGTTLIATLRTRDPAEQVARFYRDALHARAEGREFADLGATGGPGSTTLVLADTARGQAVQVRVAEAPSSTTVQIVSTRSAR